MITSRVWALAAASIYVAAFVAAAGNAYFYPRKNWDMLAYIGVVESYTHHDPQSIYQATLAEIEPVYTPARFQSMTRRRVLSSSADIFYEQLPFYRVKPLYTGSMYVLHRLGMGLAQTTWTLSVIGLMGIGSVTFCFCPRALDPGWWRLGLAAFLYLPPFSLAQVSAMSTPDTGGTAFAMLGFCLWVYRGSAIGFGACMLMAQLLRPEMTLLTWLLALFFAVSRPPLRRMPWLWALVIVAAAAALHVSVDRSGGYYGWRLHYYYTFIQKLPHPAEANPPLTLAMFLSVQKLGVEYLAANAHFLLLALLTVTATALEWRRRRGGWRHSGCLELLCVLWIAMFARFIAMPGLEERYYYCFYFLMFYPLAELLGRRPQALLGNLS